MGVLVRRVWVDGLSVGEQRADLKIYMAKDSVLDRAAGSDVLS